MMLVLWTFCLLGLSKMSQAASSDPWGQCPVNRQCKGKFGDGSCDRECLEPECLRDGFDCLEGNRFCNPGHVQYCRDHYANSHCELGCDNARCGWDGSDCFRKQKPQWAKGTLILHTHIPLQRGTFTNSSLLWALSVLLQTTLKPRGSAPLAANRDLFTFNPQQLTDLLAQASTVDSNGSLLFLQVDNRPCSRLPSTCFPHASEAASFLRAFMLLNPESFPSLRELKAIISIRGVREEIGSREEEKVETGNEVLLVEATPAWLWAVVAVAIGLALVLALVVFLVLRRVRQRRAEREGSVRVRHRSTVTDNDGSAKAWTQHAAQKEQRVRSGREKERNGLKKKKKSKRGREEEEEGAAGGGRHPNATSQKGPGYRK